MKLTRLSSQLLAGAVLAAGVSNIRSADPSAYLVATPDPITVGSSTTVGVYLKDLPADPTALVAFDFTLAFDGSYLDIVNPLTDISFVNLSDSADQTLKTYGDLETLDPSIVDITETANDVYNFSVSGLPNLDLDDLASLQGDPFLIAQFTFKGIAVGTSPLDIPSDGYVTFETAGISGSFYDVDISASSSVTINSATPPPIGAPDGGATAAMLALGLCGLFGARRFAR